MEVSLKVLHELHGLYQQLSELRGRKERGPKQIAAHQANVAKTEAAVSELQDRVKQNRVALDQKQLDLKSSENRVSEWKVKLNTCQSNKEYQTLLEQIAAAEMAASVLEDEILEGLERIEQLEMAVRAAAERQKAARAEEERVRARVSGELQAIVDDIARVEARLKEEEGKIPVAFRAEYARVVHAKGADGLSPVEDGVCTGCGRQITLNALNQLSMGHASFCNACGRLLYLPDGL